MVNHESEITWMDVNHREVYTGSISKMFGRYAARAIVSPNGLMRIEFNSDRNVVKVPDWRGWSDLIMLGREEGITDWIVLTTTRGKQITATHNTLVPIYDTSQVTSGFHGETKYAYTLTRFDSVVPGDTVRVRHQVNDDDISIDFDHVSKIEIIGNSLGPMIGYDIVTKSGFYNCNDFYLWTGIGIY